MLTSNTNNTINLAILCFINYVAYNIQLISVIFFHFLNSAPVSLFTIELLLIPGRSNISSANTTHHTIIHGTAFMPYGYMNAVLTGSGIRSVVLSDVNTSTSSTSAVRHHAPGIA